MSDVDAVIAACERAGFACEVLVEQPRPDWRYRVVKVRSPNGFEVRFEGEPDSVG
ncbi:hypothetical protein BH20ACT24_BH20ACT24_24430 [soil metagenome]